MIDVETTLERLGIEGRYSGSELVAQCPMHYKRTGREDGHPSWSINIDTGLFFCFSCGYKGSILTLIADLQGLSGFDDAKNWAAKREMSESLARIPGPYRPAAAPPEPMSEARLARFTSAPMWARRRRHVTRTACNVFGVRWNFTSDSWILPVRDAYTGDLMGWQEKSETQRLFRNFPTGIKKSKTLFGIDAFQGGRMVVVESPLDAVRMYSEGVHGAVATYGAVVSKAQILLMSAADEVVFALDNPFKDDAGRKASIQLLTETKGVLKSVRFFDYRGIDAKDPGDMTPDQIEHGITHARSRAYGARAVS